MVPVKAGVSFIEIVFYLLFASRAPLSLIEAPPRDLASLVPPKVALARLKVKTDEANLLRVLGGADDASPMGRLVKNLGAEAYATRKRAARLLASAGEKARPFLKEAAKSEDPEVRVTAREILRKLKSRKQQAIKPNTEYARKLFAVRALAEMKSRKAVPALKRLSRHGVPTLADAARDALARIEGKKPDRPKALDLARKTIARLPSGICAAGFLDLTTGASLAPLRERAAPAPGRGEAQGFPPLGPMVESVESRILDFITRVGNVRLDSVSLLIAEKQPDLPENMVAMSVPTSAILIVQGLWDPDRLRKWLRKGYPRRYRSAGRMLLANRRRRDYACVLDERLAVFVTSSDRRPARQWMDVILDRLTEKVKPPPKIAKEALKSLADGKARFAFATSSRWFYAWRWQGMAESVNKRWMWSNRRSDRRLGLRIASDLKRVPRYASFTLTLSRKGQLTFVGDCGKGMAKISAMALTDLAEVMPLALDRLATRLPKPLALTWKTLGGKFEPWTVETRPTAVRVRVSPSQLVNLGLLPALQASPPRDDPKRPPAPRRAQ